MWKVDIKGNHKSGEICVVNESFKHGFLSWGWFGRDKICVHAVHRLYNPDGCDKQVWDFAVKRAYKIAEKKNV